MLGAVTVAAVVSCAAAQGHDRDVSDGPGVWATPTLTVHVANEAAWAGVDVQDALDQWAPVMRMTLTDDPAADVVLGAADHPERVGANAVRDTSAGVIQSCRIDANLRNLHRLETRHLAHELGHCLGLGHSSRRTSSEPRLMHFMAYGSFSSPTVTAADLDAVRALYR